MKPASKTKRAGSYEAIKPLIELCKAGKLFEVQDWIAAGNPVTPPEYLGKGGRKWTPLQYAVDRGFHSLVKVLLDGGADLEDDGYFCPVNYALEKRRFDIVLLFVEHGYDPKSVNMRDVFNTWDPEIMRFFIERGADAETGMPLAHALCNRIRTALGVFKENRDRIKSFQEQANVALRYHCKNGDAKWTSLLLWAGADPHAVGHENPDLQGNADYQGCSALEFAALYNHYEIFDLKQVKLDVDSPATKKLLRYCCDEDGAPLVEKLLRRGLDPNDQENGGCSAIQSLLTRLDWNTRFRKDCWDKKSDGLDTSDARHHMRTIHLLVRHGARWIPDGSQNIKRSRQSLTKMTPDYTFEFVWIMAKYDACSMADIETLLRTPKMKRHTANLRERLAEVLKEWPSGGSLNVDMGCDRVSSNK